MEGKSILILCLTSFLPLSTSFSTTSTVLHYPVDLDVGTWHDWELCKPGTFAYAFETRGQYQYYRYEDDEGMTGVRLLCKSPSKYSLETNTITPYHYDSGSWQGLRECDSQSWLIGFKLRILDWQGWYVDDSAAEDMVMTCNSGLILQGRAAVWGPETEWGKWRSWVFCPIGQLVCGIKTKVGDYSYGSYTFDKFGVSNVQILCCEANFLNYKQDTQEDSIISEQRSLDIHEQSKESSEEEFAEEESGQESLQEESVEESKEKSGEESSQEESGEESFQEQSGEQSSQEESGKESLQEEVGEESLQEEFSKESGEKSGEQSGEQSGEESSQEESGKDSLQEESGGESLQGEPGEDSGEESSQESEEKSGKESTEESAPESSKEEETVKIVVEETIKEGLLEVQVEENKNLEENIDESLDKNLPDAEEKTSSETQIFKSNSSTDIFMPDANTPSGEATQKNKENSKQMGIPIEVKKEDSTESQKEVNSEVNNSKKLEPHTIMIVDPQNISWPYILMGNVGISASNFNFLQHKLSDSDSNSMMKTTIIQMKPIYFIAIIVLQFLFFAVLIVALCIITYRYCRREDKKSRFDLNDMNGKGSTGSYSIKWLEP